MRKTVRNFLVPAATLCSTLPITAMAQATGPQIYGRLYPEVTSVATSGATQPGTPLSTLASPPKGAAFHRLEVEASDSWMGFRGSEDLGGGLRALFQIEGSVAVDNGGGSLVNRNTHVGLSTPYGTLRLGNIDTVYKSIGDTLRFLGVSARNHVSHASLMTRVGFGSSVAASFHLRKANSIHYESPNIGGIQLYAQYSPDEERTPTRDADLQSFGASYRSAALYMALAHEIHRDFFGGSLNAPAALSNSANSAAHSRDTSTRLTVKYSSGATTVEADYAWKRYAESGGAAGRFQSYRNAAWLITAEHRIGANTIAASVVNAGSGTCSLVGGSACTTRGLEARQLNLGAAHDLSKRTRIFAIASLLKNGRSAQFSNLASGSPPRGADIRQVSLGISHAF